MYFLYNLALYFGLALLSPWLAYRALRGRLPGIAQRLGLFPEEGPPSENPAVWVHAVSLGEVKAATPLIDAIRNRFPGIRIVITSSTMTGWKEAQQLLQPGDAVYFPPLDMGWICRRFLRRLKPRAVLVIETELWPNLFREAKRSGALLLLVNGRISDRAFPRYRASRFFWRHVLKYPDGFVLQSAADAERFKTIGAPLDKVWASQNLKFAAQPASSPMVDALRRTLENSNAGPVIVAGSTMPGEEKYLLEAFTQLLDEFPRLWMILAPRHPERFVAVADQLHASGIPLQLRSQWSAQTTPSAPGVLLLDSIGELGAIYQLATVAYVGGTLVPTGGHNILEPAYFARPIVIGPHMENFQEIAASYLQDAGVAQGPEGPGMHTRTGAVIQIQDATALCGTLRFLLRNPEFRQRLGKSACDLLQANLGSITPILDELEKVFALHEPIQNHADSPASRNSAAGIAGTAPPGLTSPANGPGPQIGTTPQ